MIPRSKKNPYRPGVGLQPAHLAGRDLQIRRFRAILAAAPEIPANLRITGLRGVGKTVLLRKFDEVATEDGWATALLANGRGRHGEALEAAQRAREHGDVGIFGWALVELIEAAVRSGRRDLAEPALELLCERTRASGTAWALGTEAAARALVHDDEAAYRESIELLAGTRIAVGLARSRLLYGEWLRRENRRGEARELLRVAHESFGRIGAEAFAERARLELHAAGEAVSRLDAEPRDVLTSQEAQVARMARDGRTNPEIGAQLFISPKTVEYHLRKVFRKLDVSTRRELRHALAD